MGKIVESESVRHRVIGAVVEDGTQQRLLGLVVDERCCSASKAAWSIPRGWRG
jgi:hypothetical protein